MWADHNTQAAAAGQFDGGLGNSGRSIINGLFQEKSDGYGTKSLKSHRD